MAQINDAYMFAAEMHKDQMYGHHPYIYHLDNVHRKCNELFGQFPVMTIVAYLHDTLEDTKATPDMLKDKFGDEITQAVITLTKTDDITRKEYLQRFEKGSLAWKVKVADCMSNLEESVKVRDARRIKRYTETLNCLFDCDKQTTRKEWMDC